MSIPVIAAGGIGDGRGIAASFMLGAEAVQMGTRFLLAKECIVHQNYKDRVAKAKDIDTAVTGRSHGHPVRCLRNQMTREYVKLENSGKSFEELSTDPGSAAECSGGRGCGKRHGDGRADCRHG